MTAAVLEAPTLAESAAPALSAGPRAGSSARARRPLPRSSGGSGRRSSRTYTPRHQAWAPPDPAGRDAAAGFTAGDIRGRAPTTRIHRSNYQGIVLAEFAAAILLVALTPFATKENPSGLSPYAGKDLLQLAAITLVYFLLALLSVAGGTAARSAAWLGGLILLTVGLSEAAHLAQVVDLFGIGTTAAQAKAESGADSNA